ncbi:hypothetical protein, conserved [Angomonas deanei]|uniref:Uncharacterized protein n=1 Tax=Angomonas deanei TaxID=59799 RepID=A0A7G2CE66_9TRYP|nr:hypothetical protein, conserved [Angomonas deanei]
MRETRPWKRETKRRKRRQFLGPEGEKKRVEADGFRNRKGYYYRNHPVVVKEYELGKSVTRDTTNSTAKRKSQEKMDEDSLLFTNFIEDVVVRTQWCHPDIPQYYGAFTEKFVSEEEEEKALQEGLLWLSTHAREGDSNPIGRNGNASTTSSAIQSTATSLESLYKQSPVFAFSVTPLGKEEGISGERCEHKRYIDIGQYLFAGGDSLASGTEIRRRLWGGKNKKSNQYNSDYLRNTPRTALGLVMEDLSAELNLNSDSEEEDEMEHSEEDRSTLLTPSTHYQPLDRLLFSQGKKFTLVESIDITLQTADALQYMLLDKQKVPPEVSQMWMTISPSNVYVACVPAFADMDDGAGALEKGDIYSQLRTAGNSVVVFNDNDDDDLQRSGHQGSSVASFLVPTTTIALAPDGAPFADNTTGETNPLDSSPFGTPGKSQEDKGARSMVHQLHYIPIITRGTYAIKYNPPLFTNRPSAGIAPWRPHPCATSPPCYALGSLLLTLLTARPPTSPSGEPIRIPSHLPEQLVSFLRTATSTTSASPANANGTPPVSLTLAQFREQLWKHRIELQSCGAGDTTIKEGVPAQ